MNQSSLAVGFAVLAMLSWGLWAAFANAATESMEPETAMIVSYATSVVIALGYVALFRQEAATIPTDGLAMAVLAGVFSGVGAVGFYAGLNFGRTSVVTTVSALYFVVSAAIGIVYFDDSLGLREVAGIGFAVVAVVLLAR